MFLLYEMTMREYDDTHEDSHGGDDLHGRGDAIIEYIIDDKTCQRESELKNSCDGRRYILKSTIVDTVCEEIGDKYEKYDIERIHRYFLCYGVELYHLMWSEDYHPA